MIPPLLLLVATAQVLEPPPKSVGTVVCDAQPGRYDRQELALTGDNVLRAKIRLVETQAHPEWAPAAGLLFVLPGDGRYTGVQVFVDPSDPGHLTVGIRKPKDDSPSPVLRAPLTDTVDVVTQFNDGLVTVWAGGRTKSLRVSDRTVEGGFLMCSSGTFEFTL